MEPISEDIDNFTCEICLHPCPTDSGYISHINTCRIIRYETNKNGKLDIKTAGIYTLNKYFTAADNFEGIKDKLVNDNNIESVLFKKTLDDGKEKIKIIDYKVLLMKELVNCIEKVIRHKYVNVDKTMQNVMVSYVNGGNLRIYDNGKWEEDKSGERFKREVINKLIKEFKNGVEGILDKFKYLVDREFDKWDIEVKDIKLKSMITARKIDMRYFKRIERSYNAVLETLNSSMLPIRVYNSVFPLFHVDVYVLRKNIMDNINKAKVEKKQDSQQKPVVQEC